ncbi:hypothetical protein MXAZACID_00410, partial [Acidocella sp. MX-AZ02]
GVAQAESSPAPRIMALTGARRSRAKPVGARGVGAFISMRLLLVKNEAFAWHQPLVESKFGQVMRQSGRIF